MPPFLRLDRAHSLRSPPDLFQALYLIRLVESVPDALIVSVDLEQHIERQARTDSAGYYRLPELPARGYKIQTNAPGFAEASTTVLVSVNAAVRADFHLALAGQQQSANVEAEVHSIQTESSELGEVLDRATIAKLPLNRRDFLQLALLSPGVMPPVQGSELSNRGSFAMHVNGGREEFNNFLLDGIDNNDGENNRYNLQPPVDAIQEFKIATNAYNAEYGRNGAGQVNVVTRSGTNEWHGFGYEYFRNRVLDARNFFDAIRERNTTVASLARAPVVRCKRIGFLSLATMTACANALD